MKLAFPQAGKGTRAAAAFLSGAAFLGVMLLNGLPTLRESILGRPPSCMLKVFAGIPCLACRGSRAALALSEGQVLRAMHFNPLATLALLATALYVFWITFAGRTLQIHLNAPEITLGWILLGVSLVGNWIYVIARGG